MHFRSYLALRRMWKFSRLTDLPRSILSDNWAVQSKSSVLLARRRDWLEKVDEPTKSMQQNELQNIPLRGQQQGVALGLQQFALV